jgi:hypothetical protein
LAFDDGQEAQEDLRRHEVEDRRDERLVELRVSLTG